MQDRHDVPKRRQEGFDGRIDIDLERLVFIDGTWAKTNMARTHKRCPQGERLRTGFPNGSRETNTFFDALTMRGMVMPFVPSDAINRGAFKTYAECVHILELWLSNIVIVGNRGHVPR